MKKNNKLAVGIGTGLGTGVVIGLANGNLGLWID